MSRRTRPKRRRAAVLLRRAKLLRFESLESRTLMTAETTGFSGTALLDRAYDDSSILVTLRDNAQPSTSALASALVAGSPTFADGRAIGASRNLMGGIYEVTLAPGVTVTDALGVFYGDVNVAIAEPNYLTEPQAVPNDRDFRHTWGLDNNGIGGVLNADIGATDAWDITTGSGQFVVAVIDTGIDYTHPDLASNIWVNTGEIANNQLDDDRNGYVDDVRGWDFADDDNDPFDFQEHGTHVAGTIGAVGNNGIGVAGVNWKVKLMPLKIFGDTEGGAAAADIVEAINYAVRMGVKVSNNSYGGLGTFSQTVQGAIAQARAAGHIYVAAAGNDANNNDIIHNYPSDYTLDNIVAVAALDRYDRLASFSNYGAISVDLGAPGVAVLSTVPGGYKSFQGTSMASPHVAGAISLIWDRFPHLTYREVIDVVLANTAKISSLAGKVTTGGRLNVYQALLDAGDIAPPPPGGFLPPPEVIATPFTMKKSNTADVSIKDNKTVSSSIAVTTHMSITDVDVWVDVRHTSVGQLTLDLIGPNGQIVNLVARRGGSGDNFSVTTFNDAAPTAITANAAPFKSTAGYKPEGLLSGFNTLSDAFGTWRLQVRDSVKGTVGKINGWGLVIKGDAGSQSLSIGGQQLAGADAPTSISSSSVNTAKAGFELTSATREAGPVVPTRPTYLAAEAVDRALGRLSAVGRRIASSEPVDELCQSLSTTV